MVFVHDFPMDQHGCTLHKPKNQQCGYLFGFFHLFSYVWVHVCFFSLSFHHGKWWWTLKWNLTSYFPGFERGHSYSYLLCTGHWIYDGYYILYCCISPKWFRLWSFWNKPIKCVRSVCDIRCAICVVRHTIHIKLWNVSILRNP